MRKVYLNEQCPEGCVNGKQNYTWGETGEERENFNIFGFFNKIANGSEWDPEEIKGLNIKEVTDWSDTISNICDNILPIINKVNDAHTKTLEYVSDDVKNINQQFEEQILKLNREIVKHNKEYTWLKEQSLIQETKEKESQKKIDELNETILKLNRKINTHPRMPYISVEIRHFNKQIEEHVCICHICGDEMKDKKTLNNAMKVSTKEVSKNQGNTNNMDIDIEIPLYQNNETHLLMSKENDSLKTRIKEWYIEWENANTKNEISEENLINSKRFQSLISQAESMLTKWEHFKEVNTELQKKTISLSIDKETEVAQVTKIFSDKREEFSKMIFDSSRIIENNKRTISMWLNKIQSLENLLKAKDVTDIHSMYEMFTNERKQLLKQMDSILWMKKEYLNKYDDECTKNKINEQTITKLQNEWDEYKDIMQKNNIQYNTSMKDSCNKLIQSDYWNETWKRKKETINKWKDEITHWTSELQNERNHNESLIEMTETNEKGITDLNCTLKSLKLELQEVKEIQAKMSNEKLKDNQTIMLLKESKEILDKKILNYQEQIANYESYTKKIEVELTEVKSLNLCLEETNKLNEADIEKLRNQNIQNLKLIEKEKITSEDAEKRILKLTNSLSTQMMQYEALKVRYDELCKYKNFDPKTIGDKDLQKENEIWKIENTHYRDIVNCKVCKQRKKNVIITKCFHTFCRQCVEATFENRLRKCPFCRENISQHDVKEIFLDFDY